MISCYGGASEAVSARFGSAWNKFRELSCFFLFFFLIFFCFVFFLSGFSCTNIHESQNCRGRGRVFH